MGVGDLGRAVAHYGGFVNRGFQIAAVYDSDPTKIGTTVGGHEIRDVKDLEQDVRTEGYHVAMLAIPAEAAQDLTDRLVEAGIEAILCYAPTSVTVPDGIHVQYIDPVLHLQRMTYYLE